MILYMSSNGALTQLVAVGAQDADLITDDPKYSVFQQNDGKINNFVRGTTSVYSSGNSNWGSTLNFKVKKDGDMLSTTYLVIELPEISTSQIPESALKEAKNKEQEREEENKGNNDYKEKGTNLSDYKVRWVEYLGNAIIENVKLKIGGQIIDEQNGEFIQLYTDLYEKEWNKICLLGMDPTIITPQDKVRSTFLYVPLRFWFSDNLNKALPLIALQYHDVEIEVKLKKWESCYQLLRSGTDSSGNSSLFHVDKNSSLKLTEQSIKNVRLDCNFLYLDTEERKRIAQKEHRYLISQVQDIKHSVSQGKSVELNFNHPVKEIFFVLQNNYIASLPDGLNFSNKPEYPSDDMFSKPGFTFSKFNSAFKNHLLDKARILVNTIPRVEWKDFKYFYYVQNYENYRSKLEHLIYMYSFSANPKHKDPLGSLNFSRIDNSQLQFTLNQESINDFKEFLPSSLEDQVNHNNFEMRIYAINYNYLIIKSGMGGIQFSN